MIEYKVIKKDDCFLKNITNSNWLIEHQLESLILEYKSNRKHLIHTNQV